MKRTLTSILMVMVALLSFAQEVATTDTVSHQEDYYAYAFRPERLIVPATLITVGAVGIEMKAMRNFDEWVEDRMGDIRSDRSAIKIDDYFRYIPLVGHLGLGAVVHSNCSFRERLAVSCTSTIVMTALTGGLKLAINETRPNGVDDNSFPSGHTAWAFMGAELMRIEYGNLYGLAAYAVAGGVGALRLYNNCHWFNDVVAGAGIGILAARIGYWMLPICRRWFGWSNGEKELVTASPIYYHDYKAVGVTMAIRF